MDNKTLALAVIQLVKEYITAAPGSLEERKAANSCAAMLTVQQDVIVAALRADQTPKRRSRGRACGDLMATILTFVSGQEEVSVGNIVALAGSNYTRKQVYNALGRLTRSGELENVRYGMYRKPQEQTNELSRG